MAKTNDALARDRREFTAVSNTASKGAYVAHHQHGHVGGHDAVLR